MKKDINIPGSQDYDRKHKQNHISNNPRAVKDRPSREDSFSEDKRKEVREEHMNHFTNREGYPEKK